MAVTVEWDNPEHTIVRMEMIGRWTWEEAFAGADQGYDLLDSVDDEVGVIIDFSKSLSIPSNAIPNARNMIQRRHPHTGLTVFVGVNALFLSLWSVFSKVYTLFARKQNSTFAPTLEEARRILAERRASREDTSEVDSA
jgi:hypothetical protein